MHSYKFCTANNMFFPTYLEKNQTKDLLRMLARFQDFDFGSYAPTGGGTTIAHLRWYSETQVKFEGVYVQEQILTGTLTPENVLEKWLIFTQAVESLNVAFHPRLR